MARKNALQKLAPYIIEVSRVIQIHQEEVDELNVFPVPDGDTGTNMAMTWEGVAGEVRKLPLDASIAEVWEAIEHGAMRHARGNSGVILSLIIKGIVSVLKSARTFNVKVLEEALTEGARLARAGVQDPKEGTILTVISAMAEAAGRARRKRKSLKDAMGMITEAATTAVQTTPELLSKSIGKKISVVDAGGYGLSLMFRAAYDLLTGQTSTGLELSDIFTATPTQSVVDSQTWVEGTPLYDTQGIIVPRDSFEVSDEQALHGFLRSIGDSELVITGQNLVRIHVHTDTPELALAELRRIGEIQEFAVENMRLQVHERTSQSESHLVEKDIATVAVAMGKGLKDILFDLGIDGIVDGGQTSNPDVGTIIQAIEQTNARSVIVLPSNSNVILAAQVACDSISGKDCRVVGTKNAQETISALIAFDPDKTLDENIANMAEAAQQVTTGAIAVANRNAKTTEGCPVIAGDFVGVSGSDVIVAGKNLPEVVVDLTGKLMEGRADTSLITIYPGEGLLDDRIVHAALEAAFPSIDIESYRGDQPVYTLLVAVE